MGGDIVKVCLIMAVMLVFLLAGFLLRRFQLLDQGALPTLSNILLYVCTPALNLKSFCIGAVEPSRTIVINMLWVALFATMGIFAIFFLAKLVFLKVKDRRHKDIYTFISTFSNCGFLGIPFLEMLIEESSRGEAVMYAIIFNVIFNVLLWTLGIYLITQDKSAINLKKAFLNPFSVTTLIGMILYFVPVLNVFAYEEVATLQQIIVMLGSAVTPLCMIIVGARIVDVSPKALFTDWGSYAASGMRLVVAPAVLYALMLPFILTGLVEGYVWLAPIICMSMPPAATIVAFCEKYNGDSVTATKAFLLGTLLSLITLPLVLLLFG